jgi:hypothetical protein
MTIDEFRHSEPELLAVLSLPDGATDLVSEWRQRDGAAFGEQKPPAVGWFASVELRGLGVDSEGYGVVKVLRQEFRGLHVRVYSNVFAERPQRIEESMLESRPVYEELRAGVPLTEPIAIGHLPLSRRSFSSLKPDAIRTALIEPDEMLGYEDWKSARGGYF